jgi:hypothetical protein
VVAVPVVTVLPELRAVQVAAAVVMSVQPEAQVQAILAEQTIQFLLMLDGEMTEVLHLLHQE